MRKWFNETQKDRKKSTKSHRHIIINDSVKKRIVFLSVIALLIAMAFSATVLTDNYFTVTRLSGVVDNLKHGDMYPFQIYHNSLAGAGYAAPLFYGDLFLLIPAFLVLMGATEGMAMVCFEAIIYISTFIISYIILKKYLSENHMASMLLAAIYVMTPYVCFKTNVQGALGTSLSFMLAPLLIDRLIFILKHKMDFFTGAKNAMLLAVYLFLILMAHNLSAVLLTIFMGILWIIKIRKRGFDRNELLTFCAGALIFFFLSLYYTLPLLEQMYHTPTRISQMGASGSLLGSLDKWQMEFYRLFFNIELSVESFIFYSVNALLILIIYKRVLTHTEEEKRFNRKYRTLFWAIVILNISMTTLFPIEIFQKMLGFIQFTHRFNIIIIPLEIIYIVLMFRNGIISIKHLSYTAVSLGMVCLLYILFFLPLSASYGMVHDHLSGKQWVSKEGICSSVTVKRNEQFSVGMGEYLPADFSFPYYCRKDFGVDMRVNSDNSITISSRTDVNSLEIPVIHYYGYHIYNNGIEMPIETSEHGFIKIDEPVKKIDTLILRYMPTRIQSVSMAISGFTGLLLIIFVPVNWFMKNNKIKFRKRISGMRKKSVNRK